MRSLVPSRWAAASALAPVLSVVLIGSVLSSDTVAPRAYYLLGDATNGGSTSTTFSTTSAGDAWTFNASGNSATTLVARCPNGSACWGVEGRGTGIGVYGSAANSNNAGGTINGVQGVGGNTGTNGTSNGGHFTATNSASGGQANGVYATGTNAGVYASSSGNGVSARSTSTSGNGVYATGSGSTYYGVWGDVGGGGYGVVGSSSGGSGAYGKTTGRTTAGGDVAGVYGYNSLSAVGATSKKNSGVFGNCANCNGVFGKSANFTGVRGTATGNGVNTYGGYFAAKGGTGVYATTTTGTTALRAMNPDKTSNHYAGVFDGNVRINGNYVATGTKSAVVPTTSGDRLMYAEEATRNYFSDQGIATLKKGRAVVKLDQLFAQTVDLGEPYMVIVTPMSFDTAGLGTGNLTATSFEVRELRGGKGSFSFSWRVTAVRKGYADIRMAAAGADSSAAEAAGALPTQPALTDVPVGDPSVDAPALKARVDMPVPSGPQTK